ncbi:MAG TPA: hypothetical protein IGQ44_10020, partial [Geminocystis sp. M7585_C2015_104]|nr:hypothetical protein [Geminocystis sp. M7585_C2015_104]
MNEGDLDNMLAQHLGATPKGKPANHNLPAGVVKKTKPKEELPEMEVNQMFACNVAQIKVVGVG